MSRCTEWCGEHAAVVDNHVNYIDKLALYEDADEAGLLYRLPAPLGSTVYAVREKCHEGLDCPYEGGRGGSDRCRPDGSKCKAFYYETELTFSDVNYIGVTIFLKEADAVAATERMNRNESAVGP